MWSFIRKKFIPILIVVSVVIFVIMGISNATKEQVVTGVMQGVDAYDTAVVLMYDVADKPMTVKALPSIIKQIKAKNYELLPVDESMILIQHNNGNQEEGK